MRTGRLTAEELGLIERLWAEGTSVKVLARLLDREPENLRRRIHYSRLYGRIAAPCRKRYGPVVGPQGRFPSASHAARAIGVPEKTLRDWVKDGRRDWRREERP